MSDETNVTPTFVTLGEAAKRCGLSKATISRKIKAGEISVRERGEDGAFRIDPAELLRFMDMARVQRSTSAADTAETAPDTPIETQAALLAERHARGLAEARLADLKAVTETQLADLRAMLADTRTDRDAWRAQAEQAQEQAAKAQEQAAAVTRLLPGPRPERRGWRRWWRRAG